MREHVDVDVLANIVSMLRADIDGAIVLVDDDEEGRFYEKCVHQTARVVPTCNFALEILSRINERRVVGVVAIVNTEARAQGLPDGGFRLAVGDVASLLVSSKCCEKTLAEIGGANWNNAVNKEIGSLVDRIAGLVWVLEHIFSKAKKELTLNRIGELLDWETVAISVTELTRDIGSMASTWVDEVVDELATRSTTEVFAECSGLFVVELLSCATSHFRPRGIQSERQCAASDFQGMMRLVFDWADLELDPMFWALRAWERANRRYPILRHWRILDPLQMVLDQRYWEIDLRRMLTNDTNRTGMTAIKIDLDNFKNINEALGHAGGDEAIKLACKVLIDVVSSVAEIYRRGGDELVALAPGHRAPQTTQLAEKLRAAIERKFIDWSQNKGIKTPPTASIGLVDVGPGSSHDEVVRMMDEAQAQAKRDGKNRVVCRSCN